MPEIEEEVLTCGRCMAPTGHPSGLCFFCRDEDDDEESE